MRSRTRSRDRKGRERARRGGARPAKPAQAAPGLPCAARPRVAPRNSLRALRERRSDSRGESEVEARCARRREGCAARRLRRPRAAPPGALACSVAGRHGAAFRLCRALRWIPARLAVGGGRDFRGGEQRRLEGGARQRASCLTRGVLSERRARSAQQRVTRRGLGSSSTAESARQRRPPWQERPPPTASRAAAMTPIRGS